MANESESFELKSPQTAKQERLDLKPAEPTRSGVGRRRKDTVRLRWDSKPRRAPSPRDIEFQTAEVVMPNPARDAESLPFSFRDGVLDNEQLDKAKMNRLIWGDNLLAMQALLSQGYEGKIDLIYIDPPFDSKSDYSHKMTIGDSEVTKEPSVIERLAYRDTWDGGTDSYLDMLYPRLAVMKRLLSERGALYVHCDWRVNYLIRAILDEVFGRQCFLNEIAWSYFAFKRKTTRKFPQKHDTIIAYTKSDHIHDYTWNVQYKPHSEEYLKRWKTDDEGRKYRDDVNPTKGGARIIYLDEIPGEIVDSVWADIPPVNPMAIERAGYDTQKPESLVERILNASSNEGDLIADLFCGSGTTLAVAERMGRRWIGCDFGKVGIQVTRSRLVEADAKPFLIENIGNYQREMIYLHGGRISEMQRIVLKLYGATPHSQHTDLGTRQVNGNGGANDAKSKSASLELVYVGYPDRPTTAKKVLELERLAASLDGTGYRKLVILAWDFDYNFQSDLDARRKAATSKGGKTVEPAVTVELRTIPPDVYEYLKKAKREEDIEALVDKVHFHERPYLKLAKPMVGKKDADGMREVSIGIDRYVLFDFPVPEKEIEKLKEATKENFAILIDYWACDFSYDGATFRSEWQAIRGNGKRARVVPTETTIKLAAGQTHTIAVRLVDVFGNDAAAIVEVKT